MEITIAICTWNRADMLRETLRSLKTALTDVTSELEVIVVNNNSSDATDSVISDAMPHLPLRRLFEPQAGLSNARNAAVKAARGNYIVWTDDDVLVDPGWVSAYQRAIQAYPGAAFLGGPVAPLLRGRPPRWLTEAWSQIDRVYAAIDHSPTPFEIKQPKFLPYGANFAVRRSDLHTIQYDVKLGRQPSNYWLAGEEFVLLRELLQRGLTGWWLPDARVQHVVPRSRQSFRQFAAHGIGNGRTYARLNPGDCHGKTLLGRPVWLWKSCFRACRKALSSRLKSSPGIWVPKCYEALVLAGRLRETTTDGFQKGQIRQQ
jgi:glycosyltransferase involved in cell wall biosynthesis